MAKTLSWRSECLIAILSGLMSQENHPRKQYFQHIVTNEAVMHVLRTSIKLRFWKRQKLLEIGTYIICFSLLQCTVNVRGETIGHVHIRTRVQEWCLLVVRLHKLLLTSNLLEILYIIVVVTLLKSQCFPQGTSKSKEPTSTCLFMDYCFLNSS